MRKTTVNVDNGQTQTTHQTEAKELGVQDQLEAALQAKFAKCVPHLERGEEQVMDSLFSREFAETGKQAARLHLAAMRKALQAGLRVERIGGAKMEDAAASVFSSGQDLAKRGFAAFEQESKFMNLLRSKDEGAE